MNNMVSSQDLVLLTHFVKLIQNGIRWPGDKYSCSEPEGASVMGVSWELDAWRLGRGGEGVIC